MKVKQLLLSSLAIISLMACSNNTNVGANDEDKDALKILEERREFYEKRDKEQAKLQADGQKANTETVISQEEAEAIKNMTPDEKLAYKVDKAKAKIDNMLETAKKARQEELDVEETKVKVEEAIKSVIDNNVEE